MLTLTPKGRDELTSQNESITRKMFDKAGCTVKKLDTDNAHRRVDFLILKGKKQFLCEVKTIFSVGYTEDHSHQVSSWEDRKRIKMNQSFPYDSVRKNREILRDTTAQYCEFVRNEPKYGKLPFVVALFPDPYAECLSRLDPSRDFEKEISAVIEIERDKARTKAAWKLPLDVLKKVIKGDLRIRMPPSSKEWKVLRNKSAFHQISLELLRPCFEI